MQKKTIFLLLITISSAMFCKAQTKPFKSLFLERLGALKNVDSAKQWQAQSMIWPKKGFQSMGTDGVSVDSVVNFLEQIGLGVDSLKATNFKNAALGKEFLQLPFNGGEFIITIENQKITEYFLVVTDKEGKLSPPVATQAKGNCSSWQWYQTNIVCNNSIWCRVFGVNFTGKTSYLKLRYKRTCNGNLQYFTATIFAGCGC